ncbi:MAG: hypothetical protein ACR2K0_00710 [Acidimicrobiales bacterium]
MVLDDAVLAHQGGWDEVLFVALPMVVLAMLLWAARRRAEREATEEAEAAGEGEDDRPPPELSGRADG